MSRTDILKKTTVSRIKVAAPLTMAMLTFVVERLLFSETIAILSLEWLYSTMSFFAISTLMMSALMYNYKLLDHSCKSCLNRWSSVQSNIILVSNSILRINLIARYCIFKVDKKFKTYTCRICQSVEHKKSTGVTFIGTTSKK
jgi:hypothetical protein